MLQFLTIIILQAASGPANQHVADSAEIEQEATDNKPVIPPPPIRIIPNPPPAAPARFEPPTVLPSTPQVRGDHNAWVTTNDYPSRSRREGQEGRVEFELSVNRYGSVRSCLVTDSSGFSDLDTATCKLVQRRARFTPAFDEDGNPVDGTFRESVVWQLNPNPTPEPFGAAFSFTVTEDGTVEDCQISGMIGSVPKSLLERNPCTRVRKYTPFVDEDGRPVRKRVTYSYAADVLDIAAN